MVLAVFSVLSLAAVRGEGLEDMILISAVFIAAGLASALFTAPNMAIMMSTVDEGDRNDASSMNNFLRQFSKINGTIFMMVFMAGVSSDQLYNTFHQGLILFSVLMTVLALVCVVIFWRYGRSVRDARSPLPAAVG
ncbi:MAG: MFS transporter [Candidatus Methanomethylophilaceae archaeon]|nr:MFS transporter [Candidatus Methanomethylophilaceae archaeon]